MIVLKIQGGTKKIKTLLSSILCNQLHFKRPLSNILTSGSDTLDKGAEIPISDSSSDVITSML